MRGSVINEVEAKRTDSTSTYKSAYKPFQRCFSITPNQPFRLIQVLSNRVLSPDDAVNCGQHKCEALATPGRATVGFAGSAQAASRGKIGQGLVLTVP